MRGTLTILFLILSFTGQSHTFTTDGVEYILDLPAPSWRAVSRIDVHEHLEFIHDDDYSNGYLRLRKKFVDAGATPQDLFRHEEAWHLRRLPGYVVCSDGMGAAFEGHLKGTMFSYEYVNQGRNMDGRIYYLQVDNRTYYALHFTVRSDKLQNLSNQIDSIVKSFRLKRATK